jgi:hypothetical protein
VWRAFAKYASLEIFLFFHSTFNRQCPNLLRDIELKLRRGLKNGGPVENPLPPGRLIWLTPSSAQLRPRPIVVTPNSQYNQLVA